MTVHSDRHPAFCGASLEATSPGSGKRPVFFLENTSRSSTFTSKTPPVPLMSWGLMPSFFSISSARPAARG
jgi:hypothetical protein